MNALAFVDIAQGIHSFNEKNKINTRMKGFLDKHEHPISEEWPVVSNNISFLSM